MYYNVRPVTIATFLIIILAELDTLHCFTTVIALKGSINRNKFSLSSSSNDSIENLLEKAKKLRNEAQEIRDGLTPGISQSGVIEAEKTILKQQQSPWNVDSSNNDCLYDGVDYRLYIDIGREPGSWMDPRWGSSGQRIELTVDVRFVTTMSTDNDSLSTVVVDDKLRKMMVQDNLSNRQQSSHIMLLQTAKYARLRQGFVQMKCENGAYRIDTNTNKSTGTVRFFIQTEGVGSSNDNNNNNNNNISLFNDVSIPKGCLYFSLPVFSTTNISKLSQKDGPVSVRQMGWHTGWYREESRIVGVFKAVPIDIAKSKDGF